MRMKQLLLLLGILASCVLTGAVSADTISPAGEKLIRTLDAMGVDRLWLPGVIVNWRTGEPTGQPITDNPRSHTHCSQFAAAACDRMGVYLLHPPEHSSKLLANAQYEWLATEKARRLGWSPVPDEVTAQEFANKGRVVVAVYKNPDPEKHGHIALIRPSDKPEADIKKEGPQITQAGGTNYQSGTLKQGFANHPGAFKNHEIKFYTHAVMK